MINAQMKEYSYYTYSDPNAYGQRQLIADEQGQPIIQGTIKIAINISSQSVQDNIKYKDCSYMGLTFNRSINDSFVIQYGEEKLKVLYVNTAGRYRQVFLKEI